MNMKKKNTTLGLTSLLCLTLAFLFTHDKTANAESTDDQALLSSIIAKGEANFVNTHNENVGTALFQEGPNGVLIKLDLRNLPAGEHAIHIHETGACTPIGESGHEEDKGYFKDAGGHFNPHHNEHGLLHAEGPHAGDMPNITIAKDGSLQATLLNDLITLKNENKSKSGYLFDADGSALIIHNGTDDYQSPPTGNAGSRIACAVIKKSK